MRPDGSSRTRATCAAAHSLAVSSEVIRDTCERPRSGSHVAASHRSRRHPTPSRPPRASADPGRLSASSACLAPGHLGAGAASLRTRIAGAASRPSAGTRLLADPAVPRRVLPLRKAAGPHPDLRLSHCPNWSSLRGRPSWRHWSSRMERKQRGLAVGEAIALRGERARMQVHRSRCSTQPRIPA